MKLHTVLGTGFGNNQTFSTSNNWRFRNGKFFVNYPHDGPIFMDNIYIYKKGCYISKEVVAFCGFYNHKKHGLFTDREPQNNRNKVTIALVVNGFIRFHEYRFLLLHKRVIHYFKRQENSKASLTILVLSSKNNIVNFDVYDSEGKMRTFSMSLSFDKKGNNPEVKIIDVDDRQEKPTFWKPILSLICNFFRPLWRPRVDCIESLQDD